MERRAAREEMRRQMDELMGPCGAAAASAASATSAGTALLARLIDIIRRTKSCDSNSIIGLEELSKVVRTIRGLWPPWKAGTAPLFQLDSTASRFKCSMKTPKETSSVKRKSDDCALSCAELCVTEGFNLERRNRACDE